MTTFLIALSLGLSVLLAYFMWLAREYRRACDTWRESVQIQDVMLDTERALKRAEVSRREDAQHRLERSLDQLTIARARIVELQVRLGDTDGL